MRFNRVLALGILTCLLAGLLIGASQATVKGALDHSPMTIPSTRLGDRVTYATFERPNDLPRSQIVLSGGLGGIGPIRELRLDGAQAEGASSSTEATLSRVATYEAIGSDKATDDTGLRHDVLVFSSNERRPDEQGAATGFDHTRHEYVDRQTRLAIQSWYRAELGPPMGWTIGIRSFDLGEPSVPGLEFQGRTIRLDDDLTKDYERRLLLLSENGEDDAAQPDEDVVSHSLRRWVADRAIIDGRDAYAIRTEATDAATLNDEERREFEAWFGRPAGPTLTAKEHQTAWVAQDTPYPLVLESRSTLTTGGTQVVMSDEVIALQEAQAGPGAPVIWGDDLSTAHYRDSDPDLERTLPGQLYPADGAGSRLPYPLAAAMTDVEGDPRLVEFRLWRQDNPNHYLVSAELTPGEQDTDAATTSMWRLLFATPRGDAFEVTSERAATLGPPMTKSIGAKTIDAFKVADLPEASVTLAAAERLWIDLAGDSYKNKNPNYVHWGLYGAQSTCLGMRTSMTQTSRPVLRTVTVGYTNEGGCVAQSEGHDESSLSIDGVSGKRLYLNEWRIEQRSQIIGAYSDTYQPMERRPKEVFTGIRPPDVERAAVASTSLLAAFLVVYFLPALKFVGFKALLLVPGYAKLRKEDLLDNKIRDQILQIVRNDPGVHTSDLAQRVDAGWGTTVYHLSVLEKNGLVSSLVDGRYHRFFPVGVVDFSARGQLAVMKNLRTKEIYERIAQDPGIVQENLASQIGISAPAAIFHLKRLEEVGMVGRVKKGRKVHYYANERPRITPPADPKDSMEFA